ncbi:MAG: DUF1330 domain-containing protein [Rhodospirillaceae bacterium]
MRFFIQAGVSALFLMGVGSATAEPENIDSECAAPVIMLVLGQIENQEPMSAYGTQLRQLSTYPEQQGYYQFTRPTEVFEGEWPDNQFVIGAKFPCVEAARGFWYSDDYQAIRHLRAGAGKITVTVHPIADPPARIDGTSPKRLFSQQNVQQNP